MGFIAATVARDWYGVEWTRSAACWDATNNGAGGRFSSSRQYRWLSAHRLQKEPRPEGHYFMSSRRRGETLNNYKSTSRRSRGVCETVDWPATARDGVDQAEQAVWPRRVMEKPLLFRRGGWLSHVMLTPFVFFSVFLFSSCLRIARVYQAGTRGENIISSSMREVGKRKWKVAFKLDISVLASVSRVLLLRDDHCFAIVVSFGTNWCWLTLSSICNS